MCDLVWCDHYYQQKLEFDAQDFQMVMFLE
jgi:hypothetical protein